MCNLISDRYQEYLHCERSGSQSYGKSFLSRFLESSSSNLGTPSRFFNFFLKIQMYGWRTAFVCTPHVTLLIRVRPLQSASPYVHAMRYSSGEDVVLVLPTGCLNVRVGPNTGSLPRVQTTIETNLVVISHLQKFQELIHQHRRPKNGLHEPKHAFPECRRMLDKINRCTDERHAINAAEKSIMLHWLFHIIVVCCNWSCVSNFSRHARECKPLT